MPFKFLRYKIFLDNLQESQLPRSIDNYMNVTLCCELHHHRARSKLANRERHFYFLQSLNQRGDNFAAFLLVEGDYLFADRGNVCASNAEFLIDLLIRT